MQRALEAQEGAERRARALKTQLVAESKRASSLDRLLQTYARDAYKRVGYDQVCLRPDEPPPSP